MVSRFDRRPCMFTKGTRVDLMEPVSSPAAQRGKRRPAGDRLALGTSDAADEQDRGRPRTLSPNSRQNRAAGKPTSSHSQGRARAMMVHPVSEGKDAPVVAAPQTFVGI